MKTIFYVLFFLFSQKMMSQSLWKPLPGGGTDETVLSLYDDGYGYLWATGFFTQAGTLSVNYVARHNGANWLNAGDLPNAGFGFIRYHDTLFIYGGFVINGINYGMLWWSGSNWVPYIEISSSGYINTACEYNGDLIIGGRFTSLLGNSSIRYLAKYHQGVWSAMISSISGPSAPEVHSVYVNSLDLYVGGYFNEVNNISSNSVIRWNGSIWQSIQSLPNTSSVSSINNYSGSVIVAGNFFIPTSRNIVKLNDTTCVDLGGGTRVSAQSSEFFDNKLFIGGSTTFGSSLPNVVSWDGISFIDESNGVRNAKSEAIYVLEKSKTSDILYIGGTFSVSLGDTANFVAYRGTFPLLPIELSEFSCLIQEGRPKLVWKTVSELNNKKFEVERSTDGSVFTKVGEVPGAGTTTQIHEYHWVDSSRVFGTLYFRLKQIDFDSSYTYSNICEVSLPLYKNVSIFPNPFDEEIKFSEPTSGVLYNIFGQKILEVFEVTKVNTIHIAHGSYYFVSEKKDPVHLVK